MNKQEIMSRLKSNNINLNYEVIYLDSVDSTNNFAKKYNGQSENNLLVIAEKQTAGRGRYGRSFASPENKGLYFTLKISKPAFADIESLPLTAAEAVKRAVKSMCGIELTVKPPNDLLYESKKICGILVESKINKNFASYVIVGIGLNVNTDITDFPDDIKNIASSLKIITGEEHDRYDLLCGIVSELTEAGIPAYYK